MKKLITLAALFALASGSLFAQIGRTQAQWKLARVEGKQVKCVKKADCYNAFAYAMGQVHTTQEPSPMSYKCSSGNCYIHWSASCPNCG